MYTICMFWSRFLYCLNLMYVFIVLVKFGYFSDRLYWEIDAHSAYDMFCKNKCLIVNCFFPASVFGVGTKTSY